MNEFLLIVLKIVIPFVVMSLFLGGFWERPAGTPWYKGSWVWLISALFTLLVVLFANFIYPALIA